VTKKDVVEGMKLDAGAMPYEIVDLSEVWVLADVYESDLEHVAIGMPAALTLKAFPHRAFEGKVSFIDPLLDPATRTVKVRLVFPNATGELRANFLIDSESRLRAALAAFERTSSSAAEERAAVAGPVADASR
jgi:multidrug efflux pump subunit AcrA (membrane-fusion protein)